MKSNFRRALDHVLEHEGGFSNHPRDPGGATNKGIIQRVYNSYLQLKGEKPRSVRNITDEEVVDIYRSRYWNVISGDSLPAGLDYCVFDYAVNSGPSRSIKYLQKALNKVERRRLKVDGQMGPATLNASQQAVDLYGIVNRICDARMSFLQRLRHWDVFGKGWTRRVKDVRRNALRMLNETKHVPKPVEDIPEGLGKPGDLPETKSFWKELIGLLTGGSAFFAGIDNVFAMITVLAVLGAIGYFLYQRKFAEEA